MSSSEEEVVGETEREADEGEAVVILDESANIDSGAPPSPALAIVATPTRTDEDENNGVDTDDGGDDDDDGDDSSANEDLAKDGADGAARPTKKAKTDDSNDSSRKKEKDDGQDDKNVFPSATSKKPKKKKKKGGSSGGTKTTSDSTKNTPIPAVKGLTIPFRAVKRTMKIDADVATVQNEAAIVATYAVELFVKKLAKESHRYAKKRGHNTIKYEDVAEARVKNESLAFLDTLLP